MRECHSRLRLLPRGLRVWMMAMQFFLSLELHAQPVTSVSVKGLVTEDGNPLGGALVRLLQNGSDQTQVTTGADGKFEFPLKLDNQYLLIFSKSGFTPKKIFISTESIPEDITFVQSTTIEVDLFRVIAGLDVRILENPIGKFFYYPLQKNIDYDRAYTQSIQEQLEKLQTELSRRKKDQKKVEEEIVNPAAKAQSDSVLKVRKAKEAEVQATREAYVAEKNRLENEAKAKAEADKKSRREAEEAEKRTKAEASVRAVEERNSKEEAQRKQREEEAMLAKAEAEAKAMLEDAYRRKANADARAKAEAEAKARAEAEAERQALKEAAAKLSIEAEAKKSRDEAERKRRDAEAAQQVELEAARRKKEEQATKARADSIRVAEMQNQIKQKAGAQASAFAAAAQKAQADSEERTKAEAAVRKRKVEALMQAVEKTIAQDSASVLNAREESHLLSEEEAKARFNRKMSKEERAAYLSDMAKMYPEGMTVEQEEYPNFKITRVIIKKGQVVDEYKMIAFRFGSFYKKNDFDTTDQVFKSETRGYENYIKH